MNNVLTELAKWTVELPFWEQAALEKIITCTQLQEDDYEELLRYLLEDAGLEKPLAPRPSLELHQRLKITEEGTKTHKLSQITDYLTQ